ncbi:amidohydrolase family protein [Frankia sp. R82]|uniref:amidohydrolase family protein n=1 Tax=Frankia sp. R82 TaxID=2950553 RepID=UPI002043AA3E|nr:amidohydrolase family protein [Frankia sp. R82]MCM3883610.1 amidohydrolase family protein [Frankia sp. R82]
MVSDDTDQPLPESGASGEVDTGSAAAPVRAGRAGQAFTLRECHVLDRSGRFGEPCDVAVRNGVVQAVGPALPLDPEAIDVDARGLFVMPGVIDCHAHVTQSTYDPFELVTAPLSTRFLQTAEALRATLLAGVTWLRDAGGADAGVRDALAAGAVPGPALAVSVVALSRTGRHGDGAVLGPGLESTQDVLGPAYPERPAHSTSVAGDLPTAVRGVLRAGADWVMIYASGGVMSTRPGHVEVPFAPAELVAAVAEAGRFGRPVMMHALGERAVEAAVAAGARSIEHGIGLGERAAAAMAARGVTLVPTLSSYLDLAALVRTGVLPGWAVERAEATAAALAETIAVARAAGVRIALGSDARHRSRHGGNLAEISHLRRAGLTPPEALLAATANGAALCAPGHGRTDDTTPHRGAPGSGTGTGPGVAGRRRGRLAPGYVFDAIVLDTDPGDLSLFERRDVVRGVFTAGRAVLAHPRLPPVLARGAWAFAGPTPAGDETVIGSAHSPFTGRTDPRPTT